MCCCGDRWITQRSKNQQPISRTYFSTCTYIEAAVDYIKITIWGNQTTETAYIDDLICWLSSYHYRQLPKAIGPFDRYGGSGQFQNENQQTEDEVMKCSKV